VAIKKEKIKHQILKEMLNAELVRIPIKNKIFENKRAKGRGDVTILV
jgi:hypothetical protein